LETGNQKLENGNWGGQLPVSNFQFLLYGMDAKRGSGNWKMENGNRKLEIGNRKIEIGAASFQFLISSFCFMAPGAGLTLLRARQILSFVGLRITGRK
jgi:hypothetical protein